MIDEGVPAELIARHNIVWAVAAGNTYSGSVGGDRDLWRPDHAYWLAVSNPSYDDGDPWENHMKAFATGKELIATYARRDGEGGYAPIDTLVRCREAREAETGAPRRPRRSWRRRRTTCSSCTTGRSRW